VDVSRPRSRDRRADIVALVLIVCAVAVLALKWADEVIWSPDALFYQSRVEQIRGKSREEALHKVWDGPLAAGFRADDSLRARPDQALADPRWIPESYKLYARRWTVPVLAAAVYPIFGVDSLEAVNIFGTLVFAVALFLLLRQRFEPLASFIGVAAVLAWPDLRWAFLPLSDAWGLAMLTVTFLIGIKALDGWSRGWLAAWIAAILVLSVTRELTPIAVFAAGAVAIVYWLRERTARGQWREPAILAATGVLATLPAQFLFQGKSLNWGFAYAFSGNRIPTDTSWSFVFDHYWSALETGTRQSFDYLFAANPVYLESAWPLWPFTIPLLVGLIILLAASAARPGDPYLPFMRGAFVGELLILVIAPTFQDLRYEYPLLPLSAVGIALAVGLIRGWISGPRGEMPGARSGPVRPLRDRPDSAAVP
jgi:hypothetical protein